MMVNEALVKTEGPATGNFVKVTMFNGITDEEVSTLVKKVGRRLAAEGVTANYTVDEKNVWFYTDSEKTAHSINAALSDHDFDFDF